MNCFMAMTVEYALHIYEYVSYSCMFNLNVTILMNFSVHRQKGSLTVPLAIQRNLTYIGG